MQVKDKRKCPKHNQWMRKGCCENCLLEREAKQKQYEILGGKNKPKVKVIKI